MGPKSEYRNSKSETNSNDQSTKFKMRFEIAAVPLHKWRASILDSRSLGPAPFDKLSASRTGFAGMTIFQ